MTILAKRHHPDWIASYVQLFNGRTEAPVHFHFWTAVSVMAGVLTRHVWIDEIVFRYYPNCFIVFIAPPGALTKSTAIGLGTGLLKQLDLKRIYLAADNTTYASFIQELAARSTELRDHTAADAMDDEWINQCAVTISISELGQFLKIDDEEMINGLTDLWDCRDVMIKGTKHNGTDVIEHPFVNLIAGTTPDWIRSKFKTIGGWGLSARMIFVYADRKARLIARPSELWAEGEFASSTKLLLDDLYKIAELNGPMRFDSKANDLAHSWYEDHARRMEIHNDGVDPDPWLGHFLARKQAHAHKLAMILSCARRADLIITESDLLDAIIHVNAVELELPNVFREKNQQTPLARMEQELLAELRADLGKRSLIPRSLVLSKMTRLIDSSTASRIVDNAISRGELGQEVTSGITYVKFRGMQP